MGQKTAILAFSGGLDTSAIIPWLKETYGYDVIAYCADLGNGPDPEKLEPWAIELGAKEFIFEDLKEIFASDFVFDSLRAGAIYQEDYLLGCSVGRPLIAARMAHFAKEYDAVAVCHGATGKGNDQLRFEQVWAYLLPNATVIAPWKEWSFKSRTDLVNYLDSKGYSIDAGEKKYSIDENLMQRSCGGDVLEDVTKPYITDEVYNWVKSPENMSKKFVELEIGFDEGRPVSLNDRHFSSEALLTTLNEIAGEHGIGHIDVVEDRIVGMKTRDVHETPGATLLHEAFKQLKSICWDRKLRSTGAYLGYEYGNLIYDGLWFSDSAKAIRSFFDQASLSLSGVIGLKLASGQVQITKRYSPYSLYDEETVSFESDEQNLHEYAKGYSKLATMMSRKKGLRDQEKDQSNDGFKKSA